MLTYILYFSIFVAAFLLFEIVASSYTDRRARKRARNRRMALFQENLSPSEISTTLRTERGLDARWEESVRGIGLRRLYTQSGVTMRPSNLFLVCLAVAGVLALATGRFGAVLWMQALMVIPLGLLLNYLYLRRARAKRIDTFTRQLPDALDVIVRSLRAGHPFNSAVALVGREMADPAGTEFGILSDEISYGIDIDTAMTNLIDRVGADDLQFLAITMNIHRTSGGNLAEILSNLSKVIRDRYLMKAKIKALSAEGRWSAKLLSLFPIIIFLIIRGMVPTYFDSIYKEGIEVYFWGFCIVMMLIGNYVIRRMVNFDF